MPPQQQQRQLSALVEQLCSDSAVVAARTASAAAAGQALLGALSGGGGGMHDLLLARLVEDLQVLQQLQAQVLQQLQHAFAARLAAAPLPLAGPHPQQPPQPPQPNMTAHLAELLHRAAEPSSSSRLACVPPPRAQGAGPHPFAHAAPEQQQQQQRQDLQRLQGWQQLVPPAVQPPAPHEQPGSALSGDAAALLQSLLSALQQPGVGTAGTAGPSAHVPPPAGGSSGGSGQQAVPQPDASGHTSLEGQLLAALQQLCATGQGSASGPFDRRLPSVESVQTAG